MMELVGRVRDLLSSNSARALSKDLKTKLYAVSFSVRIESHCCTQYLNANDLVSQPEFEWTHIATTLQIQRLIPSRVVHLFS